MSETKVVNLKLEPYDVYMGRPSKWGNPFQIGVDGSRSEVVRQHDIWLRQNQELIEQLPELIGKRLGCFCSPLPCHVDNIVKLMQEKGLI